MSSTVYKGRVISQTRQSRSMTQSLSGVLPVLGQSITYESGLERNFIRTWLLDPDLVAIVAQPAQIPFIARNGRPYVYPPDFFVQFTEESGRVPLLAEVKPNEIWKSIWFESLPKWRAASKYAQERGWEFKLFDEVRVNGVRLRNVNFLQRYRNLEFDPIFTRTVLNTLALMGAAPFHFLLARHFTGNEGIGRSHLWHLIATRQVFIDCDLEIDDHTILRTRNERT